MLYTVSAVPGVTPPFSPLRIPLPESWFGPTTFLWDVPAPDVARAVRPGHSVMARLDEHGEQQSLGAGLSGESVPCYDAYGPMLDLSASDPLIKTYLHDLQRPKTQSEIGFGLWRYPVSR